MLKKANKIRWKGQRSLGVWQSLWEKKRWCVVGVSSENSWKTVGSLSGSCESWDFHLCVHLQIFPVQSCVFYWVFTLSIPRAKRHAATKHQIIIWNYHTHRNPEGIFTYMDGWFLMVNVGKYAIHGCYLYGISVMIYRYIFALNIELEAIRTRV